MTTLAHQAETMLSQCIIPFWKSMRDDAHGGYYGYQDFDLVVDQKAEKGCILNSRILWFFSSAAMVMKDDTLTDEAHHAYAFLQNHCMDREEGGLFWSLNYDGSPADTTKHTYNQAFAIYALSAYYELTGSKEALETAYGIFQRIETSCCDSGGYLEAFTRNWTPAENDKLSENGVIATRTMNTLLHVFEGYSGLYQATGDEKIGTLMRRILGIYANKIYDPELKRQTVFMDEDYNQLIDLHSYGHDIESSWLMDWGCALLEDAPLYQTISSIDDALLENVYGLAYRKHSLRNEREENVEDETRIWWVQAEAVLGFVHAFEKHPEQEQYSAAAIHIWQFIKEKLVDPRPGSEWFWEVDADGVPTSRKPILEPWKCPYHNGRLCLELIRRNPNVSC